MNATEELGILRYRLPPAVTVSCTTKSLLIKLIQLCRVENPCFATRHGESCTKPCQWRDDCRKPYLEWLRTE